MMQATSFDAAVEAPPHGTRALRGDGQQARARLLAEALRLFSENGYARTSTRAIAQAAGINLSAISYYFGDKQGLYRCAFIEPFSEHNAHAAIAVFSAPDLTLEQALRAFYAYTLAPLQQGERMQHCLRLHMRELLEPTGMWQAEIDERISPLFHALWGVLCRHLGLARPDADVHWLALALAGMPVHLLVAQDVVHAVSPQLLAPDDGVPQAVAAMTRYGLALVQAEAVRRGMAAAPLDGEGA